MPKESSPLRTMQPLVDWSINQIPVMRFVRKIIATLWKMNANKYFFIIY